MTTTLTWTLTVMMAEDLPGTRFMARTARKALDVMQSHQGQ
jgi:hypothetical protein